MSVLCVLLISLLAACAAAQQCAPTFPAVASCAFTYVPPVGVTFYIDQTQTTWVEPSSITMFLNPNLSIAYSVSGQFTHSPPGGQQFTVNSQITYSGWWGTYSPSGETCGCGCSGLLMLASVSDASTAMCTDSYASSHPGAYNFCTNFRFLSYYFQGPYRWALNQDATNQFLLLSRDGDAPGGVVGSSFTPYTSTPGAFWGQPVAYLSESGTCS